MACDEYNFDFAIWDGDGKHVYDSYLYGTDYSECYDPTACYLYQIASLSGNCNYEIVMDGKLVRQGNVIYDPAGSSLVIRVGECTETCPGKNELVVLSYIEYGDIDYILQNLGQDDVEGLILEGDAESFCIDIEACNVILRTKLGLSFYFLLDKEEVLEMGGFEKTRTFGNCEVQDQDCPKMEFFMNCDQYFFAIWDGDGKHVYDSYIYGTDYSECYDPTACYLYEIASESGNCNYEIVMDGKVVREGKTIYDPDGSSLVIRAGECTETCPGKNELVVLSYIEYIEYGDIDYILHISGQGDVEGLILEGDAKSFCIDIEACNVIVTTKLGWSIYFLLDKEEVLEMGELEKTRSFGNCD